MKYKALLAALLAVVLCLVSGCGKDKDGGGDSSNTGGETVSSEKTAFTLAYSSTDVLNPYTAATRVNQELSQLLFDPLVKLDSGFQPVYVLAESVSLNGTSCVIKLRSAKFSDGSAVTAEDVTYSIKKARESATRYKTQVDNIKSASASGASTVSLTFQKADPYAVNLLDFPIIKMNSDTRKDDDNRDLPPVGSGRYIYDSKTATLQANPSYMDGSLRIASITLMDAPDTEALQHAIEVGSLSMYFTDLSDNVLPKMVGKSVSVYMNNLVYLGVNFNNGLLAQPEIRQALSAALDRTTLTESAYYGHALPASTPFPSVWQEATAMDSVPLTPNMEQVVANLEKVGYNKKDNDGYWVNDKGNRVSLRLTCNMDNSARLNASNAIKEQLAEAGIEINVRTINQEAYTAEVTSGAFDLYLGEVKLPNNMDITQLVTYGGSVAYGLTPPGSAASSQPASSQTASSQPASSSAPSDSSAPQSGGDPSSGDSPAGEGDGQPEAPIPSTAETVADFYAGRAMLSEITSSFTSELPVIPLLHRCGQVTYSSRLAVGPVSTISDLFFGIEACSFTP